MLKSEFHYDDISNVGIKNNHNLQKEINNLIKSPNLFPYELDIINNKIHFVVMNEKLYKRSFFILSPGKGPGFLKGNQSFSLNLSDVVKKFKNIHFSNNAAIIYNHGFCCSTLLSRLIEESFSVLSLKEPPLLNALSFYLNQNNDQDKTDIKTTIFNLHNRSFRTNQKVLWKPSDYAFRVVNDTESLGIPSIYLYSPLEEYIASCLKKKRSDWIKKRANYIEICEYLNIDSNQINIESASIQATLYWCSFAVKYRKYSIKNNIRALSSSTLLNNPSITKKVGNHLKLNRRFNIFEKYNRYKLLNTYAKTDSYKYSKKQREFMLNNIIKENLEDIQKAKVLAERILDIDSIDEFKFYGEIL